MAARQKKNQPPKTIEIVAGPNGSGKTTFATVYLLGKKSRSVYLNPDRIAGGIAPLEFEKASFQAGRVLINEVKSLTSRSDSFAFESTLSGRTWFGILRKAVELGYNVKIYFVYLDSVGKNIQRIKRRVELGGHFIPTEAVYRRHPRCFENFWNLYRPLCSDWYVFDNSNTKPQLIESKTSFETQTAREKARFERMFLEGRTS